jgi:hypothetical protein
VRQFLVLKKFVLKNCQKKMKISHHFQIEGGASPKGVPTTGLAADTMPVVAWTDVCVNTYPGNSALTR